MWLTGEVVPCHRMEPPGQPWPTRIFGNVRDEPLLRIWNRPEFQAFRRGVLSGNLPGECRDCTFCDSVVC
jgi:radical SAM protein with 4Fe4S-binding SPASM domain